MMMRATICPAIALFLFFFSAGMELKADTVISAGLVGTGGMTDLAGSADSGEWKRGFNAGGGLAMEVMFTPRWGLFTGLLAGMNRNTMVSTNPLVPTEEMDTQWTAWRLTMPLCGVVSFNPGDFSLQFMAGGHISHILTSRLSPDPVDVDSVDVLRYLNYYAVGATAGFNIIYRAGHYTDLLLGITAAYDISDLNDNDRGDNSSTLNLWDAKLMAGVLLRTELFP